MQVGIYAAQLDGDVPVSGNGAVGDVAVYCDVLLGGHCEALQDISLDDDVADEVNVSAGNVHVAAYQQGFLNAERAVGVGEISIGDSDYLGAVVHEFSALADGESDRNPHLLRNGFSHDVGARSALGGQRDPGYRCTLIDIAHQSQVLVVNVAVFVLDRLKRTFTLKVVFNFPVLTVYRRLPARNTDIFAISALCNCAFDLVFHQPEADTLISNGRKSFIDCHLKSAVCRRLKGHECSSAVRVN